eukprot:2035806-Amphidinium_carterae.1
MHTPVQANVPQEEKNPLHFTSLFLAKRVHFTCYKHFSSSALPVKIQITYYVLLWRKVTLAQLGCAPNLEFQRATKSQLTGWGIGTMHEFRHDVWVGMHCLR